MARKKSDRLRRASAGTDRPSRTDELFGDGGADETAAFIAATATDLARLAQYHRLEMLGHLLRMAQLEAEEHVRLRSKPKLS